MDAMVLPSTLDSASEYLATKLDRALRRRLDAEERVRVEPCLPRLTGLCFEHPAQPAGERSQCVRHILCDQCRGLWTDEAQAWSHPGMEHVMQVVDGKLTQLARIVRRRGLGESKPDASIWLG